MITFRHWVALTSLMAKKGLTRSLCFGLPLNLNLPLYKALLQANVPGLVVNAGSYASTTAMAMYAQESALNKTMVDVVGLATAGMPYLFWG